VRVFAIAALVAAVIVAGATGGPDKRPILSVAVKSKGKVTTFDGRIGCRVRCSARYGRGRLLRLSATPDSDFLFYRWHGACIGAAAFCDLVVDGDASVHARFIGVPTQLVVSVGGPGRVTNAKARIDCGPNSGLCFASVPYASRVKLTPKPDGGGRFGGWAGQCASAGTGPCVVRIERPQTEILGAFGHSAPQAGPQQLSVHLNSSSHVTSAPEGIDCSPTCSALFPSGTLVVLTRLNSGVWQGPCVVVTLARCALIVDVPTEVGIGPPPPPPAPPPPRPDGELQVTVSGGGLVRGENAGISCGWSPRTQSECSYDFETYATVTRPLRAVATRGVQFVRWGGLCHGKSRTCLVHMTNNRKKDLSTFPVTAVFRRR